MDLNTHKTNIKVTPEQGNSVTVFGSKKLVGDIQAAVENKGADYRLSKTEPSLRHPLGAKAILLGKDQLDTILNDKENAGLKAKLEKAGYSPAAPEKATAQVTAPKPERSVSSLSPKDLEKARGAAKEALKPQEASTQQAPSAAKKQSQAR